MKKSRGFTIVEIALVLGIAGLIMVMAFVALPSLWSSQRDANRRANVMNFISALKTFQTNNSRGELPTGGGIFKAEKPVTGYAENNWGGLIQDYYLKSQKLEDPGGYVYSVAVIEKCDNGNDPCQTSSTNNTLKAFNTINKENTPKFDIAKPIIYVIKGATCDEGKVVKSSNPRYVAAVQVLEKGKYCHNT